MAKGIMATANDFQYNLVKAIRAKVLIEVLAETGSSTGIETLKLVEMRIQTMIMMGIATP